jgi:cytochrome c peroxidase
MFDDLPPELRGNVNREAPFGGISGGKPALDRGEIRDVVAFLRTLDDGYSIAKSD